jgi:hypothetical protein
LGKLQVEFGQSTVCVERRENAPSRKRGQTVMGNREPLQVVGGAW